MHLDIHFGERLKVVRSELGLSQQRAADVIGVRREMWAKYEAGAEPGAKAIAGMIVAGFDVRYILTGVKSDSVPQQATGKFNEKDVEDAIRKMLVDASMIKAIEIHDEKTFELLVMMTILNLEKAGNVKKEEDSPAVQSKQA